MRENNYFYATHNGLPLPSRQEQHRYASDKLSEKDFCTEYATGYTINKIASSLRWTESNSKRKRNNS